MDKGERIGVALAPEMADRSRRAVDDLRKLTQEGLESGKSARSSMREVKAEARRRLEASLPRQG